MDFLTQIKEKLAFPMNPKTPRNFHLKVVSNGFLPYNTATITVRAYQDPECKTLLPNTQIQWYREIENRKYKVENQSENYFCSFEDIGSKLIVVVSHNDKIEVDSFGPICLDPRIKIEAEPMVLSEKGKFEVQYSRKNEQKLDSKVPL